jgi:hypothetical protein
MLNESIAGSGVPRIPLSSFSGLIARLPLTAKSMCELRGACDSDALGQSCKHPRLPRYTDIDSHSQTEWVSMELTRQSGTNHRMMYLDEEMTEKEREHCFVPLRARSQGPGERKSRRLFTQSTRGSDCDRTALQRDPGQQRRRPKVLRAAARWPAASHLRFVDRRCPF